jgi:uncharacterized protein YbcV (DUF1398 family)
MSVEDNGNKFIVQSKLDKELFNEENNIKHKIIRVKRETFPNKGEKWKVLENDECVIIIDGNKLTDVEKTYLRTANGLSLILSEYKKGTRDFRKFRSAMKLNIK